MKRLVFLFSAFYLSLVVLTATAQNIFITESSQVTFFSDAPLQDIEAVNKAATSIITLHNDSIAFQVPIKGFTFKSGLMQTHFNETYMESDKKGYEYATLKGKLSEKIDFKKDGEYKVTVTGNLKMHGVEKPRTFDGTITVKGDKVTVKSQFKVLVADHKIKIPSDKIKNIGSEVLVTVEAHYKPYVKP